jgi:hypothetical protein
MNIGYGFIFSPPLWGALVNIPVLLVQWVVLGVFSAIGFFIFKK